MFELADEGVAPETLVDLVADMAVEVAVGAQRQAEGPVHIERDVVVGRAGHDYPSGARQASMSARNAMARWEIACFASGSISAKVAAPPAGMKIGS